MAKLLLKFEQTLLKELPITEPVVTVGRLPDNAVQLDNPAVSSYHAKIYWDRDHYAVEDNNSLNGTYLNQRRVSRHDLKDGDSILIGKHTLVFASTGLEYIPGREGAPAARAASPELPRVEQTLFLDTKQMKDMLADKSKQSVIFWVGGVPQAKWDAVKGDTLKLPALHSPLWAPDAEAVISTATEAMTVAALDILKKS